jgi:multidrug resistance protein, MATE family
LVFIALSLGIGFSFAITPLIAEADGAGDLDKGRSYFHHGIILSASSGVFLIPVAPASKAYFISP